MEEPLIDQEYSQSRSSGGSGLGRSGNRRLQDGSNASTTTDTFSQLSARTSNFSERPGEGSSTEANLESIDYLPANNAPWRKHITKQEKLRSDWVRWYMMAIIGFAIGLLGYALYTFIDALASFRYNVIHAALELRDKSSVGAIILAILLTTVMTSGLVLASSLTVVYIAPQAAASGVPEVMAYLNGCLMRKVFNIRTLLVKFASCVLAVASGLPVGPEGPMIHLGAILGAGISQGESTTLGFAFPIFPSLRNSKDKRDFITAGVAAGVAVAFGTPIGGLLFAFEEIASFWQRSLGWQIFFSCMCATFALNLFQSAEYALDNGHFGLFANSGVIFEISQTISTHALALIPAVVIGLFCGVASVWFCRISQWMASIRKKHIVPRGKIALVLEPVILGAIFVSIMAFLPIMWECKPVPPLVAKHNGKNETWSGLELYICKTTDTSDDGSPTLYNEMASLAFGTGEDTVKQLLSRNANQAFGYPSMLVFLVIYFVGAACANGMAISSGLFVPMLVIGSLIGRLTGMLFLDLFVGRHNDFQPPSPWAWINPGVFALIGAGAFMGGVTRLTIALVVIIMEMSSEVHFVLPIMAAVMTAKSIADALEHHSIYEMALVNRKIPFLSGEGMGQNMKLLETLTVSRVMCPNVVVVNIEERISSLRLLLKETSHNGFPVVTDSKDGNYKVYTGFITRDHLQVILRSAFYRLSSFDTSMKSIDDAGGMQAPKLVLDLELSFEELNKRYVSHRARSLLQMHDEIAMSEPVVAEWIEDETTGGQASRDHKNFENVSINLRPFVNTSAIAIHTSFSVARTYILFRTLGLRHLTILDESNQVTGIVTRKDLTSDKLDKALETHRQDSFL